MCCLYIISFIHWTYNIADNCSLHFLFLFMTIYKWVKFYLKAIWELISLWTFHIPKNLIKRSTFLYVISVNDLLIGLRLAIFLLLHQRKNTLCNSKRTDINYCLLSQNPHYQSVLGEIQDEKVAVLYYTHYALVGPLNILNWCIHKEYKGFWAQYMLSWE